MIELDHELLLLVNGMHTDYLDALMWYISAKLVWVPFYLVTLWVVWKNYGWKGILHILLMVGVMVIFADAINSSIIRPIFHRLRPANLDSPVGDMVHVVNGYRGGKYGFPSAHAANYCGLSWIIWYFLRSRKVAVSLILLTAVICYSRSYLGVHYPGDLAAGIIYSTAVMLLIMFLHNKYFPLKRPEPLKYDWLIGATALLSIIFFALVALFDI